MVSCFGSGTVWRESALSLASTLYVALAGVVCVFGVTARLGISFNLPMALTSGATILGIYLLNRVSDIREDFVNQSGTSVYAGQEQLFLIIGGGLLGLAFLLNAGSGGLTLYFLVLVGVGVSYSYPIVPWLHRKHLQFVRIKQIPFLKTITVAVFWGVSVFAVPLALSPVGTDASMSTLAVLLAALSLATFSNTLFSDIRDTAGDRLAGNNTIPVLLGEKKAYALVAGANALLVVLALVAWGAGLIGARDAALIAAMAPFSLVYLAAHWNGLPQGIVEILSDTHFVVYGLGLMIIS